MPGCRSRFVTAANARAANGGGIAVRECGRRDGDTLVLLHGFGGSGRSFDPIVDEAGAFADLILPDLPGHGRSAGAPGARHPRAAAQAVLAALDAAGRDRFHLAGFSMGGAVACLIALAAPERVRSLTLLAPGGFGPDIAAATLRRFAAAREPGELRDALGDMTAPGSVIPEREITLLAEERDDAALVAELTAIAELISRDGRQGEIPRDLLGTIACPVRVLWGMEDPVLPATQSRDLPARFRLRLVEGAGHMLIDEAREEVLAMLAEAVAETAGP